MANSKQARIRIAPSGNNRQKQKPQASGRKPRRTTPILMSELSAADREHFRWLHGLLDRAFAKAKANKWSWAELARRADVNANSVSRLGNRLTFNPTIKTVRAILAASGIELTGLDRKGLRKAG